MIVWLDGALVDEADARISPLDHGLLTGDGAFETLRVYGGVPFAWRRHLERLAVSAGGLGLPVPADGVLHAAADAVLAANGIAEGRLRITVTGGHAPLGSERSGSATTVLVAATPVTPWPATTSVVIVPWTRNERGATAGLKTISYAENVRALAWAAERGAGEAVFANTQGNLCEATGSNVFLVVDGVLTTPPASAGCLLGVTRALVLELAAAAGIPSAEIDVPVTALARADEAFLSSTTREVQGLHRVDSTDLPGAPGPITATLAAAFRDLVDRDPNP